MKSETLGTGTSEAEVTQISKHGIWLLIGEKEHFLSFENFPWFKDASVSAIHNVEVLNEDHLYWPDLDVDLAVESIEHPERFPLVANANRLVIGIGLEDLPDECDLPGLKRFLANQTGFRTYGLAPTAPGVPHGAGLDLMLVLGTTASVASIASLLWTAYDKFIASKKSRERKGVLHIIIRRPDGGTIDFQIGKDQERDVFITDFSETIRAIQGSDDPSFWLRSAAEIEENEIWMLHK